MDYDGMPYQIITGDITKYDGDIIINSLGVSTNIYGGICGSIVKAATKNKDELVSILSDVNDVYTIGDVFITGSYGLPCKKIMHVVMPFASNDNPYCDQYKKMLDIIFIRCIKKKLYKIGIPMIGCGANGYKRENVCAYIETKASFYKKVCPELDVSIVIAPKDIAKMNRGRLEDIRGGEHYHDEHTLDKFKKGSKQFDAGGYINSLRNKVTISESKQNKINSVSDYVKEYASASEQYCGKENVLRNRINRYFGYGNVTKQDVITKGASRFAEYSKEGASPTKNFLLKTAFAIGMSLEEVTCFLNFFGYSFAHFGVKKEDDIIRDLFSEEEYDIIEINKRLESNNIKPLFSKGK